MTQHLYNSDNLAGISSFTTAELIFILLAAGTGNQSYNSEVGTCASIILGPTGSFALTHFIITI